MLRFRLDLICGPCPLNPPCGCVFGTAPTRRPFGFDRASQWAVSTLGVYVLVLLFALGHEMEVIAAIAAAMAAGAVKAAKKHSGGGSR
ncbi:hypothetical protein ABT330_33720 [Streptomyces sp. NPDC000658]|uniref:hypothetical protein n=1 Tax=Streptomyces sp. NPDC000658 TaxID=3154266 RepID=UPI00331F80C9